MSDVLNALGDGEFHRFERLFDATEGRRGVVVTFLAMLELAKEQLIEIVQEAALAPIYVKSLATADGADAAAVEAGDGEPASQAS
jgi:segregation and condensation protein A